jgi:hypothetical protein
MRNLDLLNIHRLTTPDVARLWGDYGDSTCGAFMIPFQGIVLKVIASSGGGWDHVSVSLPNRCPSWDEMSYIKSLFFKDDEMAIQYHMPAAKHINIHNFCLHLWRPYKGQVPTPPTEMV